MTDHDSTEQTRVGHCKRDETDVYIGRASGDRHLLNTQIGSRGWLGNPYPADVFGREECIEKFRSVFEERLHDEPEFRKAVRELAGETLGCWCQSVDEDGPECHGEVIAEHADRLAGEPPVLDLPIAVLSIESRFAGAIYRDVKPYEYRRQPPARETPYCLLLYEKQPIQAVTGAALVTDTVTGDPDDVVNDTVDETTHGPLELLDYFEGADEGTALDVRRNRRFAEQVHLSDLGVGSAPQNFQYVEAADIPATVADELRELVGLEAPIITEDTTA